MKSQQKILKKIPSFRSEKSERDFWEKSDTTKFFEMGKSQKVRFPNLKYSTESISLRLPVSLLDEIKVMANKMDVPYQSLIKIILADRVQDEALRRDNCGLRID